MLSAKATAEAIETALQDTSLAETFRPVGEAVRRLNYSHALKALRIFVRQHDNAQT